MRRRLDAELVRRGLAASRGQAQTLIEEGKVLVNGAPVDNVARQVSAGEPVVLVGPRPKYVSRGGEKLEAALDRFSLDVAGKRALDVGASTGGFTDCLLQRGASSVVALDVGHGQLHERLRADERVEVYERTNVRHVSLDDLGGERFEVITIDVSFISLKTIAPVVLGDLAAASADVIALVKPQFEAGKAEVSKGKGVVKGVEIWRSVLEEVTAAMIELRAATMGVVVSPIVGAQGNVEFLLWMQAQQERAGSSGEISTDRASRTVGVSDESMSSAASSAGSGGLSFEQVLADAAVLAGIES